MGIGKKVLEESSQRVVILQDTQTQTDEFGPLSAWMKHDYSPKVTLF